jgi:hypothetical protein
MDEKEISEASSPHRGILGPDLSYSVTHSHGAGHDQKVSLLNKFCLKKINRLVFELS